MDGAGERSRYIDLLVQSDLGRSDQVVGLLWYLARNDPSCEIAIDDLIDELELKGLAHQNRPRIKKSLASHRGVVKGRSAGSVRLAVRALPLLEAKYGSLLGRRPSPVVSNEYLPVSLLPQRPYMMALATQLNGTYDIGYFDAAAVMLRRLIESLILEIYISRKRQSEVKSGDAFLMLDKLISHLQNDHGVAKSRDLIKALLRIKSVGDTAAHSRHYITLSQDLDDLRLESRRAVAELASLMNPSATV